MAKFKLFLLTPDIERETYFTDVISSFQGQFTQYNKKTNIEQWSSSNVESENYSFNEKLSLHTNAQKELTFDMTANKMLNNNWVSNIFVSRINIGSLILLIDKYDNAHLFIVKSIKTQLLELNTLYSYTCQDAFSYSLTRQNEGYTITNDPSTTDFIGAKLIDWWVEKICSDCYISDQYVKLNDVLYKGYNNVIKTTSDPNSITDSVKIIKSQDLSILQQENRNDVDQTLFQVATETFSFSCSGSSALGALLSLGELVGYSLNYYESVMFFANRVKVNRYFWFEPSKIDNISPYLYSPKKNIEAFSLDQSGDSLTTVLNIKTHTIADEQISVLPPLPPRFASWFQSESWKNTKYTKGFFTDLLSGKVFSTTGNFPNLEVPDLNTNEEEEEEVFTIVNSVAEIDGNLTYFICNDRIWFPIYSNAKNTLELSWWDSKIQFSKDNELTYFYVTIDDSSIIYNNHSFYCDIKMRLPSDSDFISIREYETIPDNLRGKEVQAFFTIPALSGAKKMWKKPNVCLYMYSDISEDEKHFAEVADQIPWLENKIIDFSYFYQQGILTYNEYFELMNRITNDLRKINGQLLCYAQEYYKAIQVKTTILAELETAAETLHAELEAEGISKYASSGATNDLKEFLWKNAELSRKYSSTNELYGAREIQNNYLNKYFQSQQRFLKNIYKFREYFNSPAGESVTYYNKYTFTIQKESGNYISFSPNGFISCKNFGVSDLNSNMVFYKKENKDGVDTYSTTPVITNNNYKEFYITSVRNPQYNLVSPGQPYDANNMYFIKGRASNSEFITKALSQTYVENQYYGLNETQIKQYYYYCAWDTDICTQLYLKKTPDFFCLGKQAAENDYQDLSVDCLYFYDETDTEADINSRYKKVAYANQFTPNFKGWVIKNDNQFYTLTAPVQGNPYTFALKHNYNNYVEEINAGNANYFISADAALKSAEQRWNESEDNESFALTTYDNYWKYRVVCSGYTSPKGTSGNNTPTDESGNSVPDINLYTPKIYYELVNVERLDDGTLKWTDSNRNEIERPDNLYWSPVSFRAQWGGNTLACLSYATPILLEKDEEVQVPFNNNFHYYRLIDYKIETMFNETVWQEFYLKPVDVFAGGKLFDPLTMTLTSTGEEPKTYLFTDVCSDLYFLTPEEIAYIHPTEYKEYEEDNTTKIQYYNQKDDGSYEKIVSLYDIQSDSGDTYYIENSLTTIKEDSGQITETRTIFLNLYLNEVLDNEIVVYKYPKTYKINLTPKDGNVSGSIPVSITLDEGKTFQGIINIEHSIIIDRNNYCNGDFWYNNITNEDNKILKEKAMVIEEQLTEYWLQAYAASKYCDFFIPEHWQIRSTLQENKFFNRIFSISGNHLSILPSIPNVSIYATKNNTFTTSYSLIWDPYGTQTAGRSAAELAYANPAFVSLAEEMLGGFNNLSKIKLEPLNQQTTYYYPTTRGWRWSDVVREISSSNGSATGFTGLYGLMFKWSQGFIDCGLSTYENLLQDKETLWKELHYLYPNIFLEGVFEYPTATSSEELLQMAQYAFKGKSQPEANYSLTILDIFSLKGYNGEELRIGYPIMIDVTQYKIDNLNMQKAIDQYLFITDISYGLRSDTNISITVNSIKYDDKLIQKLVRLIR